MIVYKFTKIICTFNFAAGSHNSINATDTNLQHKKDTSRLHIR